MARRLVLIALVLAGLIAAPQRLAAAPDETAEPEAGRASYDLKYRFRPGEVIRSQIVHRATIETSIQGSTQTAESRSSSVKVWEISAVKRGQVTFVHSVESIDMWHHMQGRQEVRYNSLTDAHAPPGYEDVAKAVGVPLTVVTMDERGKISRREEKRKQPNTQSQPMTIELPAEPVSIGQSWSVPQDIDVTLKGGSTKKIQTRQLLTLQGVKKGVATIQLESQILTPLRDPAIEAQLIQRLANGTIRFDIDAGRILSQQMDLDRRVLGFSGPSSSMHYLTRFTEELMTGQQTARKPSRPKQTPSRPSGAKSKSQPASKALRR